MQHQIAAVHPEAAHLTKAALVTLALWLTEVDNPRAERSPRALTHRPPGLTNARVLLAASPCANTSRTSLMCPNLLRAQRRQRLSLTAAAENQRSDTLRNFCGRENRAHNRPFSGSTAHRHVSPRPKPRHRKQGAVFSFSSSLCRTSKPTLGRVPLPHDSAHSSRSARPYLRTPHQWPGSPPLRQLRTLCLGYP